MMKIDIVNFLQKIQNAKENLVYVGLIVGGWWAGGVRRYSVGGDGVLSGRTIGRMGLRSAAGLGCGGIDGWEVHFYGGL